MAVIDFFHPDDFNYTGVEYPLDKTCAARVANQKLDLLGISVWGKSGDGPPITWYDERQAKDATHTALLLDICEVPKLEPMMELVTWAVRTKPSNVSAMDWIEYIKRATELLGNGK